VRISWFAEAWESYLQWAETDAATARKINDLIRDARRDPFRGLGKPEPLKNDLAGWWSRRITAEHRLVYRVVGVGAERQLVIMSCRYHYPLR
jgi:toxin YoeB